jgi:TRAP-type C4-dicarboxylate transport system permease small subunit
VAAGVAARRSICETAWPVGILATAIIFVWAGIEFTKFAWRRTSELADLPLWYIHVAWPVTGLTWMIFLGQQFIDDLRIILGRSS